MAEKLQGAGGRKLEFKVIYEIQSRLKKKLSCLNDLQFQSLNILDYEPILCIFAGHVNVCTVPT